jgi:hypothetical protein
VRRCPRCGEPVDGPTCPACHAFVPAEAPATALGTAEARPGPSWAVPASEAAGGAGPVAPEAVAPEAVAPEAVALAEPPGDAGEAGTPDAGIAGTTVPAGEQDGTAAPVTAAVIGLASPAEAPEAGAGPPGATDDDGAAGGIGTGPEPGDDPPARADTPPPPPPPPAPAPAGADEAEATTAAAPEPPAPPTPFVATRPAVALPAPPSPFPTWAVPADERGRPVLPPPPPPPPPPPAAPEGARPFDPAGPQPGSPGTQPPPVEAPTGADSHPVPRRGLETSAPASWTTLPAPPEPTAVPTPTPVPGPADRNRSRLVAIGILAAAALVAGVIVAGVILPALRDDGPVSTEVVGRCFTYTAGSGPRRVDRVVSCDGPHDGLVLALAADAGACPSETNAVLVAESDAGGRGSVLCIRE